MQTSRFTLGLVATLAVGLGFSLASSQAIGYPAGSVVSTGTNPVRSATGHWDLASPSHTGSGVMEAPSDQDLILTEVVVGVTQNNDSCWASGRFRLQDSSGTVIANIPVHNPHLVYHQTMPTRLGFTSGIRVPAGTVIDAQWDFVSHYCSFTAYDLDYVLSGYLATP